MQINLNLVNNRKINNYNKSNSLNSAISNLSYVKKSESPFLSKEFYSAINPNFKIVNATQSIEFLGHKVHIMQGGADGCDIEHFARAINTASGAMEIETDNVIIEPETELIQLENLERRLSILANKKDIKGQYIAIPVSAAVSLKDLEEQYNDFTDNNLEITPENVKLYRKELISFLKVLYDDPDDYPEILEALNSEKQELQFAWGVINQINKLVAKGAKVYISAGEPIEPTLKWLANKENINHEFYTYARTSGEDPNGNIARLKDIIEKERWYDFNLLALSDANIVNAKDASGKKDFVFSAYDSCVTDGERGVYNLSPVRKNNFLLGYSFTDNTTCQYPYREYPETETLEPMTRFVGKKIQDVIASPYDTEELRHCAISNIPTFDCPDKLYPVDRIYSTRDDERAIAKMQGDYVDKTLEHYYDINKNDVVICPNCDYENSGKPSVRPMWGSQYSIINAIARDIALEDSVTSDDTIIEHKKKMRFLINNGKYNNRNSHIEKQLKSIIEADKAYALKNPEYFMDFSPRFHLAELYFSKGRYDEAQFYYDSAIHLLAKEIVQKDKTDITGLSKGKDICRQCEQYEKELAKYNSLPSLKRDAVAKPVAPGSYDEYNKYKTYPDKFYNAMIIGDIFSRLSEISEERHDYKKAKMYQKAANTIARCNETANIILLRRKDDVRFMEDLFED